MPQSSICMKIKARIKRHKSIRKYLKGTSNRPRLAVFRSAQHIYAQIIDDTKGVTLLSESDLSIVGTSKQQKAYVVGSDIAKKATKEGIKEVVFDRGGFMYHGRVKALAEGARKGGLKF